MANKKAKKNILIGCTGSVASIKLPILIESLKHSLDTEIRVIVTHHAKHFYSEQDIPKGIIILTDEDEWSSWNKRGDPVVHIDLVKWADLFVIAPLDANTLGKMANGLCDNLLTCVVRAWDLSKPLLFCPAMNTKMWDHPITAQQIEVLQKWGYTLVPSVTKTLMCGDHGQGAMAEVDTIVSSIVTKLYVP